MFSFFVVFTAVVFGAQSSGTIFSFAPDMGKAKQASAELKQLFERPVSIGRVGRHGGGGRVL